MSVHFEPFDPKLLAESYSITLNKSFEELLLSDESQSADFMRSEDTNDIPVLPDQYFENVDAHLRPSSTATAQQRYDAAVKLLIRDCSKQHVRARAEIKPGQQTGAFYLFLQTKGMADFYKHFGHNSIIFMDSGFRVNRNAFPITFISVLDNFNKGRMVGVMISQFTDEHTYAKCLSELKRGELENIHPQCSMTDFDLSELTAFQNTWPWIVVLLCSFHTITSQNKWVDKNVPKCHRERLKEKFKALHYASSEEVLKKKLVSFKRYCTVNKLDNAKVN